MKETELKIVAKVLSLIKEDYGDRFKTPTGKAEKLCFVSNWLESFKSNQIDLDKIYENTSVFLANYWYSSYPPQKNELIYFLFVSQICSQYADFMMKLRSRYLNSFKYDLKSSLSLYSELKRTGINLNYDELFKSVTHDPQSFTFCPNEKVVIGHAVFVTSELVSVPPSQAFYAATNPASDFYNDPIIKESRRRFGYMNLKSSDTKWLKDSFNQEYLAVLIDLNLGQFSPNNANFNIKSNPLVDNKVNTAIFLSKMLGARR